MSDTNLVVLMGNLTRDPELKYGQSGNAWCSVTVASNHKVKDVEETVFQQCVFFGKTAELLCQYAGKGKKVLVTGRLRDSNWEKDGVKHTRTEVVVNDLKFLGAPSKNEGGEKPAKTDNKKPLASDGNGGSGDDEIPF